MHCQSDIANSEHSDEDLYESGDDVEERDKMNADEQRGGSDAGREEFEDEDGHDGCQPEKAGDASDGIMEAKSRSSAKRVSMPPAVSPAKRFRYDIAGETPFDVVDLPCLRGRHLKVPIPLPTLPEHDRKKFAGTVAVKEFVLLTHRAAWISQVCLGRVSGGKIMDRATKQVRQDLLKAIHVSELKKRNALTASAAACRVALVGLPEAEPDAAIEGDTAVS